MKILTYNILFGTTDNKIQQVINTLKGYNINSSLTGSVIEHQLKVEIPEDFNENNILQLGVLIGQTLYS